MIQTNNKVYNLIWIIVWSKVATWLFFLLSLNQTSGNYLLSLAFFVLFLLLYSLQNLLSHWIIFAIKPIFYVLFVQRIVRIVRKLVSTEKKAMRSIPVRTALSSCTAAACIKRAELWKVSLVEGLLSSQSEQGSVHFSLCIGKVAYRGLILRPSNREIPSFPFPAYILHDWPSQ